MSPCDSLRCISRVEAESSSVDKDADNKSGSVLRPLLFTAHISPIAGIAHLHNIDQQSVVKVDRRIRWHYTTTILRLRMVHDSRGIKIVNFTISFALSAGTLMASAGTPYRLVPAHFYPCQQ